MLTMDAINKIYKHAGGIVSPHSFGQRGPRSLKAVRPDSNKGNSNEQHIPARVWDQDSMMYIHNPELK